MEGDLGAMLESVLSDPGQMEKIAKIAQGLMGANGEKKTEGEEAELPESGGVLSSPASDSRLFSVLGKTFAGREQKSRSTALLMAMRPYMRPEKQEKLDRAVKIAQMVNIAGAVMKEYGGDFFGI